MRAPGFWSRPRRGWQSWFLAPLARLYAAATARRLRRGAPYRARVPVICVGNLSAGGTGKTPTAIALAQRAEARGRHPVIVSRGHGGSETGPVRVDETRHDAAMVGDEPLLMAAFAQVVVGRDRAAAVRMAENAGAGVIIMDDGFQNPAVAKDLSIVVVDAGVGFGNGAVIPAGPLREPAAVGLARADAVLSIGPGPAQDRFAAMSGPFPVPLLTASLRPLPTGLPLRGLRALAFAGIGRPGKFFDTLSAEGVELVRTVALGDHQPLTPGLMTRLRTEAKARGLQLITTEKDATRLPQAFRREVMTVPVRLEFDDEAAIEALLDKVIPATGAP